MIAFALSSGVWVTVKTFGLPAALFVFMIAQYKLIEEHGTGEEKAGK